MTTKLLKENVTKIRKKEGKEKSKMKERMMTKRMK